MTLLTDSMEEQIIRSNIAVFTMLHRRRYYNYQSYC